MQQNYRYNEKTFFNPVKKKLANNIRKYTNPLSGLILITLI